MGKQAGDVCFAGRCAGLRELRPENTWRTNRVACGTGTDGRAYPRGNTWNAGAVSLADKGRTMPGPDAVDAHPLGASPFGVMDLVGNVWQWTTDLGLATKPSESL
jgi:formylglycine-generating enzyme required for sulfatase activity